MAHVPAPGRLSPMVCPLAKLGTMEPPRYRTLADNGFRNSPLDPSVYSHIRGTHSPHHFPPRVPPTGMDPPSFRNSTNSIKDRSCRTDPSYRSNNMPKFRHMQRNLENYKIPDQFPSRKGLDSPSFQSRSLNVTPLHSDALRNCPSVFLMESNAFQQRIQGHTDPLRSSPALRRASSPTADSSYLFQAPAIDTSYKLGRSSPSLDQGYHTLVSPSPGPSTPGPWTDPLSPSLTSNKGKKLNSKSSFGYSQFEKLPDDAIVKIFEWLDSSDLCVCARVCKRWETLAWEPQLWKTIKLSGDNICGDRAVRGVLRKLCGQGTTGACPTVEKVFLSDGAKLTDKGLTQLARRCTELTHVQLQGCVSVTNNALFELATRCTNLQHLDLTGCIRISCLSVTPGGPEPPRRLLLQYLDLTDCAAIDDGGLRVIVRNCPQLVYLYLRRCVQITDTGIKFIPSFCSMLRELSVSDCSRVTDFGLHELAKLGSTLRYLSVAKCDQVSDAGLKMIARRCYKLRYLNARGCEAVSDDAITVLARSCPRLRALDIGKCDVSDAGLRALAESCPNLKKLSLRNCDLVTDRGVQCIAYYCRGLQQLNVQDCQISLEGYRAVKKYCKRCVIEHTNPGFF